MSNEIKQGDKVRVSKDAPRIYTPDWVDAMFNLVLKVTEVEDGNAMVEFEKRTSYRTVLTAIPCKYLVKVDAEAKEAKFKVGELMFWLPSKTIRHKCTITEVIKNEHSGKWEYNVMFEWGKPGKWIPESELTLYIEPTDPAINVGDRVRNIESGLIGVVDKIVYENIAWVNGVDGKRYHCKSDGLELIEPTEQAEAEKKPNYAIKIPVEVDLSDSYWDAYAADLAKEVALKVANKYNDPKEAAEYAVLVAKSVAEGLKRK